MPNIENIVPIAVLAVSSSFGWRDFGGGRIVDAVLGGRIRDTVAVITGDSGAASSSVLRMHARDVSSKSERLAALAIAAKAPARAGAAPLDLPRAQANARLGLPEKAGGT
jgi:hypothetical protein